VPGIDRGGVDSSTVFGGLTRRGRLALGATWGRGAGGALASAVGMGRFALIVASLLVIGAPVRAQPLVLEPPRPPDPGPPAAAQVAVQTAPPAGRRWYGWQTLVPDAALLAVLVAEMETRTGGLPNRDVIPIGAFAFGVPTVHLLHRQWAHMAGSIVARVAFPVILGLANSVEKGEPDSRGVGWGIIGGMALASALDGLSGWETR